MGYFRGKKWPCLIFTVYLALAVTGAFTFSGAEFLSCRKARGLPLLSDSAGPSVAASENVLSAITYTLDCLAEDTIQAGKDNSFSSPRFETIRLFMSDGINGTGSYCTASSVRITKKYPVPFSGNSILVNLRI